MKYLSNLKIASKLYLLIAIAMIGMLAVAALSQYQLLRVFELANYATVNTVPSFNTLNDAQVAFLQVRVRTRNHILARDEGKKAVADRYIDEHRNTAEKLLAGYKDKLISDEEDKRLLTNLETALNEYFRGIEVVLVLSRKNAETEANEAANGLTPVVTKVSEAFSAHLEYNKKLAERGSAEALATKERALWISATVTFVLLLLLGGIGWLIARVQLARPIGGVASNLNQLAAGSLSVDIAETERRDEIGDIARAAQVFKEFVLKLDTQSWIKTHTAEIGAALQSAGSMRELAQQAVSRIAPTIGAGHGALYVDDGAGNYALFGSYGYRERKHLNSSFHVGEGLIGQAAMEKTPITLTAPKDYIRINSGLGEGPPACIAVLPVMHQEQVLAVLEVASFQQFSERERTLLDAVVPLLATSIEIMERNQRTKELLAATQEQAERMEKQAAQLEEQSVEMEAQQAELLETENWFRGIIEAAPDGMMVVEENGAIALANLQAGCIFGYGPGELLGMNIDLLAPAEDRARHAAMRQQFVAEGGSREMGAGRDLRAVCKDGSEVPVRIALSLLPARGHRGRCVSVSVRPVGM